MVSAFDELSHCDLQKRHLVLFSRLMTVVCFCRRFAVDQNDQCLSDLGRLTTGSFVSWSKGCIVLRRVVAMMRRKWRGSGWSSLYRILSPRINDCWINHVCAERPPSFLAFDFWFGIWQWKRRANQHRLWIGCTLQPCEAVEEHWCASETENGVTVRIWLNAHEIRSDAHAGVIHFHSSDLSVWIKRTVMLSSFRLMKGSSVHFIAAICELFQLHTCSWPGVTCPGVTIFKSYQ